MVRKFESEAHLFKTIKMAVNNNQEAADWLKAYVDEYPEEKQRILFKIEGLKINKSATIGSSSPLGTLWPECRGGWVSKIGGKYDKF